MTGKSGFNDIFVSLNHKPLFLPSRKDAFPDPKFVRWHNAQFFKGNPRD
jgi:hypothetical protein